MTYTQLAERIMQMSPDQQQMQAKILIDDDLLVGIKDEILVVEDDYFHEDQPVLQLR